MAVAAGSLVTGGNGKVLISRLQSAGPGTLTINRTKVEELGNYKSVASVPDTPQLTFTLESYDVSTDVEQLLTDQTDADLLAGGAKLSTAKQLNVVQNLKPGEKRDNPYTALAGVAIPALTLQSASYRFGISDNATETFTFQGDSIYYCDAPVYNDRFTGTGVAGQVCVATHPSYPYTDSNGTRRILAVTIGTQRLTEGPDYTVSYGPVTDDAAIATVTVTAAVPVTDTIQILYHSPDALEYPETVHVPATLKPAAVKGKDIVVYVGGYDPDDVEGSEANRLTGAQDCGIDWRVEQTEERELGNPNAVSREAGTPTVNGTITFQPRTVADLMAKMRKITGVTNPHAAVGPDLAALLPLDIVIKDAESGGATLKRFNIPDARFSVPGYSPRVGQNMSMSLTWESDEGNLTIFRDLGDPVVTGVEPATGAAVGGESVVITGVNFKGVTAVKFGTDDATSFTVDSHRQITAVTPAHTAGPVDVTVTTTIGTSVPADGSEFTYA